MLFEVKSFRSQRSSAPGSGPRALAFGGRWGDLPLEIALKTRDTLAGLVGVALRHRPAEVADWTAPVLLKSLRVIAAVAQELRPAEPRTKRNQRLGELESNLKRRLSWATQDIVVLDPIEQSERFNQLGIHVSTASWSTD